MIIIFKKIILPIIFSIAYTTCLDGFYMDDCGNCWAPYCYNSTNEDIKFDMDENKCKESNLEWIIPNSDKHIYYNQYCDGTCPDNFLLDDTVKKNIIFSNKFEEVNQTNLDKAIYLAKIDKFISSLKDGIETKIGDRGINISGGQRQRIGLARTLYFRPNMLILDESTNQLDINTEKKLLNKLKELYYDKVFIIISHRLSTLELCDEKIYLGNQSVETLKNLEEVRNKLLKIKHKELNEN